jgi:hypothetical protein
VFHSHTYTESTSTIFTLLYPLHLNSLSHYPTPQHDQSYIPVHCLSIYSLFSGALTWYFTSKYIEL